MGKITTERLLLEIITRASSTADLTLVAQSSLETVFWALMIEMARRGRK